MPSSTNVDLSFRFFDGRAKSAVRKYGEVSIDIASNINNSDPNPACGEDDFSKFRSITDRFKYSPILMSCFPSFCNSYQIPQTRELSEIWSWGIWRKWNHQIPRRRTQNTAPDTFRRSKIVARGEVRGISNRYAKLVRFIRDINHLVSILWDETSAGRYETTEVKRTHDR